MDKIKKIKIIVFTGVLLIYSTSVFSQQHAIDLQGNWKFSLDRGNTGLANHWYDSTFTDTIQLPGSLQAEGYGDDVTTQTVWWSGKLKGIWRTSPLYEKYRQPGHIKIFEFLQPEKHYIGVAWYQKEISIPQAWGNRQIMLFLERVHWESSVWIDDHLVGTKNSLSTSQEYDLTGLLRPGKSYRLTIRVDNSHIIDLGDMPHSVSDETQTSWNGIIGKIMLKATPRIWLSNIQVYPDIQHHLARIHLTIENESTTKKALKANIMLRINSYNTNRKVMLNPIVRHLSITKEQTIITLNYPMGDRVQLWDEFHPTLYNLEAILNVQDEKIPLADTATVSFGMREISTAGTNFQLNGHLISFRGDVNCSIFPLTGYPDMSIRWWKKLFTIYKKWGLNFVRFHSWCPPEEAFKAADEIGIYLQPEVDEWSNFFTSKQDSFFRKESGMILQKYGNHPSFVMLALGNEKRADTAMLRNLVSGWEKDTRRLYTGKTGGNPILSNFQYYNCGQFGPLRIRYHKGWPPRPQSTLFNTLPPQTYIDFRKGVEAYNKPLVAHEIGQRCSYPDVINEPSKYTGFLKAAYLDIARDQLTQRGMIDEVPDFVRASGMWQIELYKEEIEASMRTPGLGGFNLLSLEDFPGQSTAPVGLLDVFYDRKSYIQPSRFRHFCGPIVLLARMPKRVWENDETFHANIELYNFGEGPLQANDFVCNITDKTGNIIYTRDMQGGIFPLGNNLKIGHIAFSLLTIKQPMKLTLSVSAEGSEISNAWNFWVFPEKVNPVETSSVTIVHHFNNKVKQELEKGATVLLLPDTADIKGGLPICFTGFYWTAFGLQGGESSADGLLCDPSHPVFNYFPTSFHTDWQWWDLLTHARPMILDKFRDQHPFPKSCRPLIQMIDSWKINRKLGLLVEGRMGNGRIMICSIDLEHDLDKRPAARQFRYSLLKYITSADFNPQTKFTSAMVQNLFYP